MTSKRPARKAKPAAPAPPATDPFRLLFQNHPIPMWVCDLKTLAFLDVNDAAVEKYGYSRAEFLRLTLKDIRPPEDVAQPRPALQHSGQWRHRLKDGRVIDVEITSHTIEFNGRQAALVMALGMTQRKQAEETLRESEERFRNILESMIEGCQIIGYDWRYLFLNDTATIQSRRKKEELLGRTMMECYPGIETTDLFAALRRCMEERTPHRMVNEFINPDGLKAWFELSIHPAPNGILILSSDIAERVRAEEQMKKKDEHHRVVIENIFKFVPEGLLVFTENFKLLQHNKAFEEIARKYAAPLDYPEQELCENIIEQCRTRIERGDSREIHIPGKGRPKTDLSQSDRLILELNVARIFLAEEEEEEEARIVVSLLDITERKRAQVQIQEQLQTLSTLYAETEKLIASLDLRARADAIVRSCVEIFGARLAWIGRAEPDGRVRLLTQYPQETPYPRQISVRWDDTPEGQGPTGRAIRSGLPEITEDMASDPRFAPWRAAALQAGFCTSTAFPLISRGHTFGALNVYSDQPGFFSPQRAEMFQAFAHQAASALENARLFEETQRRLMHIQALRNIDMAITGSLDLRVTFNVALDEIVNQLGIDAATILRLDPHTQTLEYAAARGFRTRAIEKSRLRLGEGHAGRAALEQRIVDIPNLSETGGEFRRADLLAAENFIAYYAVPLIAKGRVLGVLEIFHRSPHEGDDEWLAFLEILGGQTAIAIDNAGLFHDLEHANIALLQAYDATIEGWSHALDLRDKETEGHTQRVTELTLRLARAMGMSREELVHVRRGALLHDMGKMGVPDGILLKPDKLTDEEWVMMRQHPQFAYEMLAPIAYLKPALDIPYCHHEKWDGTGYPRGLKGEQIPLAARLFAVADVWDALTSDRPYRKAWSKEKTLDYIREQAGRHFDPKALELFLRVVNEDIQGAD